MPTYNRPITIGTIMVKEYLQTTKPDYNKSWGKQYIQDHLAM